MGTDISLYLEKFNGSAWCVLPSTCRDRFTPDEYQHEIGRDYDVFAALAGVRNRRGIEPVLLWLGEKEAMRGRPEGLSEWLAREDMPRYGYEWPGEKSGGWIMAEELDRAFKTGYLELRTGPDEFGKVETYGEMLEWFIGWFDEHVRPVGDLNRVRLVFCFSG